MQSLAKNILLHNQSYQNQEISMTKCFSLICKPHWDFPSVPLNTCSDPQARPVNTFQSAVNSRWCLLICGLALCIMTMTFLKSTCPLPPRMSLNLGLFDVFFMVDSGTVLLAEMPSRGHCVLFSASYSEAHDVYSSPYW